MSIEIKDSDIVKQGFLVKQSKFLRQWKRRWFILTPSHLCSFANQGDHINGSPTEFINIGECSTVRSADEETGKENSFKIETPSRTFYLVADASNEKESWIGSIGKQMVRKTVLIS